MKFFIKSTDYVDSCKVPSYDSLPEWEQAHLCKICRHCVIGNLKDTQTVREVSQESFLDEIRTISCLQSEYLQYSDCDDDEDDITRHYDDLKEEILSNRFPEKEYIVEV